jgi:outer membrane protein, heavy metal efflux system
MMLPTLQIGSCFNLRQIAACCGLAITTLAVWAADAPAVDTTLPDVRAVSAALTQSPAYQAARRGIEAERAQQRQLRLGPQEWVGSVNAARRMQRAPGSETTGEWELGLDRTVRWPGKQAAYVLSGSSRVAQAEAARARSWREQARALLERHGAWLKDHEAARVWAEQVTLLERQKDAVTRRQRLGDAARIEEQQADAALLQARAQALATQRRSASAREVLLHEFPGLVLPTAVTLTPPTAIGEGDNYWLGAQLDASTDLELARRETDAAVAQAGVERAEQRPDPTVGLRAGQARNGSERFVGVALSLPFGGEHRAAGAEAAAARAEAAALRQAEIERRVKADATLRLREAQTAQLLWQDLRLSAQRLDQVAQGLQRGWQLGEGSLGEVMNARRLAIEQQLAASGAAVDAWLARHRLALEAGLLWPENPVEP